MRSLPAAPALVADIGGGPGRYALWLAGLGYRVEHRDLMPLHVRQLAQDAGGLAGLHTAVGDARELDLADASVDAVLLLGPLYHLRRRGDRVRALGEARRPCWPTCPNGWRTPLPGRSCWTPPAPSSGSRSCSASARACSLPASGRRAATQGDESRGWLTEVARGLAANGLVANR